MFKLPTIALISQANKVMPKFLQAGLQHYMNCELLDVQFAFREDRGTKNHIANTCWNIEKAREFQKNICFCFTDYMKAIYCVDHNHLWKILQEIGIADHLTCLLQNLYSSQETTEQDRAQWTGSKMGKEYIKAVYCRPAYLTYTQSISCEMLDCISTS